MTSPLLALPREIRDTIYARLNRDVAVKDKYKLSHNHIFVRIKGAPLPQLLLVNWQLHNEYKEAISYSAHIAIDTLGMASVASVLNDATNAVVAEPFCFHHLDARLQHILANQVRSITLMIDWCVRSAEQEKRLSNNTNLFWRMFQELAHEIVHPQVTTLKIAYLDSMGGGVSFEMLDMIERIILDMRQERGGNQHPVRAVPGWSCGRSEIDQREASKVAPGGAVCDKCHRKEEEGGGARRRSKEEKRREHDRLRKKRDRVYRY
ncbi:hypothetical protein BU25DRAFT_457135 [Macroventuria anomochaeta]|uniref:Uncharacterized protein n=1 Tax=Macroventuria anomochaeta TaxID=301207 RepID=A0ACB6S649_9PLEO|nr:uncharacterized protein BU25DRAFT_457135 [Macroventuria anomochaeta]KAF2629477.1 hypothetical protein BU25DRAFT_457135 [Macroventuria anomochaeta]